MQVFKTFFKIAYKRIGSIIIYFILFTVLALLFANTSSSDTGAFESTKIDISIIDEDKSTASKALTDYLDKNHNLVEIENEKDIKNYEKCGFKKYRLLPNHRFHEGERHDCYLMIYSKDESKLKLMKESEK